MNRSSVHYKLYVAAETSTVLQGADVASTIATAAQVHTTDLMARRFQR
jgi:hypothetical protein